MSHRLPDHPLRHELASEVHARPFMHLEPSERASYLAVFTGEEGAEAERRHIAELCRRYDAPPPADGSNFHLADLGEFRLRWERHTEFSAYAFFLRERAPVLEDGSVGRFAKPVIERVPRDWLEGLSGEVLVGLHLELEDVAAPGFDPEQVPELLAVENYAGSAVSGRAASVWMNFAINADGYGRVLVRDAQLRPRQAGRLVQRLFEIETYRMMALLALPLARRYGRPLSVMGERLTTLAGAMADCEEVDEERALHDQLTALSNEIERIAAATSYRFGAARAYHDLVQRRIVELREERIEGLQTVAEFMERRLTPAMRTCEAVADRLETLSRRVNRAGQLLRTRIDIQLAEQNRDLLHSMDRRAKLQLRLQETVEGLSVAAITYYGVGLVAYAAKGLKQAGLPVPVDIAPGLAIPLVAGLVWIGVRRVRRMVSRQMEGQ